MSTGRRWLWTEGVASWVPGRFLRTSIALLVASLVAVPPLAHAGEPFQKVKLMVNTGGKAEEQDAVLSLDDEALVVRSKGGTALRTLPYAELKSMEYSYSQSPRWKSGATAAVFVGVFASPIFFMKEEATG